ncbi:hypothetical protein PVA45_04785 [Entomospira entomophila]|uniref:2Fe-2S ferredoxin-type domain-containing protein n=1 Tax=Entomospira entomophila TaxID=2719988 RepID=A0A968KSX3_9SPIO|nr:hypothetical protein [Entomospira entomophilus]NIZ40817.1 hypothetical protein [Entomospira entomophilus]WDI35029.1 hypothetical protein PVA45_04785 [Entomospira entomophilus]
MIIQFFLNDESVETNVPPHLRVSALLDQLDLPSSYLSCHSGACGKCLILLDNRLVYSCLLTVFEIRHRHVTTATKWIGSELSRQISMALSILDIYLCPHCVHARYLTLVYFLESDKYSDTHIQEALSLVNCNCTSNLQLTKLFQFMQKVRERYER